MGSALAVKLLLSFIVGALCVCTFTVTADRFGSKVSGVLASFPATLLASYFFLALAQNPEAVAIEARAMPALAGLFGLFLSLYCCLIGKGLGVALGVSLTTWFVLATTLLLTNPPGLPAALAIFTVLFCGTYYFLEHVLKVQSRSGMAVSLTVKQLISRMISGGSIVSGSVLAGALIGPELAAVFAAFPAVTVATLIATYQSGGVPLTTAFAKSLSIGSMLNTTVLSLAVFSLYPTIGLYTATALAALSACLSSYVVWLLVHRRMR